MRKRILVVDDDAMNLKRTRMILEKHYNVLLAESGREALSKIKSEKIDLIPYDKDPVKFIENALSPAKDMTVIITDEKKKEAMAIVGEDALSLAIGKKGMNVKLASRLTHYKIDVKTYDQAREMGINIVR